MKRTIYISILILSCSKNTETLDTDIEINYRVYDFGEIV